MNIVQKHKNTLILILLFILTITTTSFSVTYANRLYFGQNGLPYVQTNSSSSDIIGDSNVQSETIHNEETPLITKIVPALPVLIAGKGIHIHSPLPDTTSIIEVDPTQLTSDDIAEGTQNPYFRDERVKSIVSTFIKAGSNTSITPKDGFLLVEALYKPSDKPVIQPVPETVEESEPVQYQAGNGLQLSDSTFSVAIDTSSLSFSQQGITISETWAGNSSIETVGTISEGTWQGSAVDIAYGGTGATSAMGARSNLGLTSGGSGDIWVDTAGDTISGTLHFSPSADITSVTIKARSGQTVPLQSWLSTTGIPLTSVTREGFIDMSNAGNAGNKTLVKLSNRTVEGYGSGFNKSNGNEFFNMVGGVSDNTIFGGGVVGDTVRRFRIIATGELLWGSGQAGQDTKLRRYSTTNGGLLVVSNNSNVNQIPLSVRAAPSQSAHIQQWLNANDLPLAYITGRGGAVFNDRSAPDADFQIKGDTDVNLFYTDVSQDKIGIGTASPTGGKIHLSISSGKGIYIANTGSGNSIEDDSGARLTANGVWTDTSDLTKKEHISGLEYGLKELLQLRPVSYSWKNTNVRDIGFIAQEVKTIIPELIYGSEGDYSMSYGHMTSLITKAIQEQQVQIDNLALEGSSDTTQSEISDIQQVIDLHTNRLTELEKGLPRQTDIASISAKLASIEDTLSDLQKDPSISSQPALSEVIPELPAHTDTTFDSIIVANHTILNSVGITGAVTAGLLSINGMTDEKTAVIETLSGTLHIQQNSLNPVAFMNGKLLVTTDGSLSISSGILKGNDMIRGINVPVPVAHEKIEVAFPSPRTSPAYAVSVTPQWNTDVWVESKSETGFVIAFSQKPSSDSFVDWIIVD